MRKLGIAIAAVLILVVIVLLAAPAFLDVNQYRGRIQAELQQRLNRPVTLGQMHLRLLPPEFIVNNAVIGENPRFGSGVFANVQQLSVSVKLLPLLHKEVELSGVELVRPQVELIRNAQGTWNFSTLGPSAPSQPQAKQPTAFQLDRLKITDGQMALTDNFKHQSRALYDHIDLTLRDFAPDKAFDIDLAAHLPGAGAETVSLAGTAGPIDNANTANTPLKGSLKLNGVSIEGVQKFLNTQALAGIGGVLSGATSVENKNGTVSAEGQLKLDDARIRGVRVGYPMSADYKLSDDLNQDVIRLDNVKLKLGSTPLAVSGTVNTRPVPAQVDLKLDAKNVSLVEAARLAAAFGVAFNANTQVAGTVSADLTAKGALDKPALNGTLGARDLTVSGGDLPAPVKVSAIDLALTPQQVRSSAFTANAGNTNVDVQFTLANYTSPQPAIDATLRTANAQITNLLAMARAYGVSALNGVNGSGVLSLDVHATGPLKNASAMVFSGAGQMQNASLKTPTLRVPLNVRNANLRFNSNSAQVENLAASLGSTNATGAMTLRNFSAPNVQFTLNADKVNVAELQQIATSPPAAPSRASVVSLEPLAYAAPAAEPGIFEKMTGGGTVAIGTIIYDQLLLTNVRSNVTLNHGVIEMSPLNAQLYGGQENGAITIDTRTTPMAVQVKSTLQRVQANDLVSAVSSVKNTLYGLLLANTQASFRAANANDIARSLNGTLALDLSNGRIVKLDLLNQLAAIGKFAGVRKNAQAVTDFTRLTGHFNINNGLASTNDLRAEIAGGTLAADGTVNLATQQLAMHVTAVLSKGFTQQIGGTGIGGLMQTALANNRGELVMPVIITGTFDQPQVAPDVQKVAQMRLQNLLPTTGNPGAATSGILGPLLKGGSAGQPGGVGGILGAITGQQQPQPAQQQGQQPAAAPQNQPQQPGDVLNQALQGILGGKKKQQQQQQQNPPQR